MAHLNTIWQKCARESAKVAKLREIGRIYDEDILLEIPHPIFLQIFNFTKKNYREKYSKENLLSKLSILLEDDRAIIALPFTIKESAKNKYIQVSGTAGYDYYFSRNRVVDVILFSAN